MVCTTWRGCQVLRNLLVHRYGDVDNEVVLEMIQSELSDVVEFERAVVRLLG